MYQEKRNALLWRVAMGTATLSLIVIAIATGFQAYVRWYINQNFTLLGGNELEVLTFSTFALIFGLIYLSRSDH